MMMDPIRLTATAAKGGCAAKLPAAFLARSLQRLSPIRPRELVVGPETMDDAALWDMGDGHCLVQTVDFFTPIVDDAYAFGGIAAANSLSDVYAMNGSPITALTVLAFPTASLSEDVLGDMMSGAIAKLDEAGAVLAGGHSIDDATLKLGFSVTGLVARRLAWTNACARPGDALILTKPLGTGVLTTALRRGSTRPEWIEAAQASMLALNRAPELLKGVDVHAATDITGFGLAGHAAQMTRASGVRFEISIESLALLPGVRECFEAGVACGAHGTNAEYVASWAEYRGASPVDRLVTVDPQTSGGLLLCVAPEDAAQVCDLLVGRFSAIREIGRVDTAKPGEPTVVFI